MSELKTLMKNIAASLYLLPASIDELLERDFLRNRSRYGVELMIFQLERKGWCYEKGGKYHTYESVAMSSEFAEYDLPDLTRKPKRLTAEQAIRQWNKKL